MQPQDQPTPDQLRSRLRKYDAYDAGRSYVHPTPDANVSAAAVPPHDVRSGYVPPQVSAYGCASAGSRRRKWVAVFMISPDTPQKSLSAGLCFGN